MERAAQAVAALQECNPPFPLPSLALRQFRRKPAQSSAKSRVESLRARDRCQPREHQRTRNLRCIWGYEPTHQLPQHGKTLGRLTGFCQSLFSPQLAVPARVSRREGIASPPGHPPRPDPDWRAAPGRRRPAPGSVTQAPRCVANRFRPSVRLATLNSTGR
jgi:hypothetical protein